jgi:hypothetical protein
VPEATTTAAAEGSAQDGAAAAAGGGGGGGGAGNVVGQILQAVADIIPGITAAAATGTEQQADPPIMAKRHSTRFQRQLAALERLTREDAADRAARDAAIAALRRAPRKQWMTGAAARAAAPAGRRACPPLYDGAPDPPQNNPGGHAYGDPLCQCPTAACAYLDPLGAAALQAQIRDLGRRLTARQSTRDGGNVDLWQGAQRGNMAAHRAEALRSYGFLLTLRSYEPLLRYSPVGVAMVSWAPPDSLLFAPRTLALLFPGDADARRGIVPALDRSRVLSDCLNAAVIYPVLGGLRPPTWIYGLAPEERARIEVGPPLGLVLQIANAPGNIGGGVNRLSSGVRTLLLGDPAQAQALFNDYLARAPILPPPEPHWAERAVVYLERHWVSAALVTAAAAVATVLGGGRR